LRFSAKFFFPDGQLCANSVKLAANLIRSWTHIGIVYCANRQTYRRCKALKRLIWYNAKLAAWYSVGNNLRVRCSRRIMPPTPETPRFRPLPESATKPCSTRWNLSEKNNRLLDVGCGDGHFLEVAQARGWEVYGTEYDEVAVAVCARKGIRMQQGSLSADHYELAMFDVVCSFEVMEHIQHIRAEAAAMATVLRQGGLAYITTPNFDALSRRLLKGNWNVIEYPEHLTYFTPATLAKLMEINGFGTQKILTTGISPGRIKASLAAANTEQSTEAAPPDYRQTDEVLREKAEGSPLFGLAKRLVNGLLNVTQSGDAMKAYFIRR
jgi:2-polyprenyl-3-methyl-5-hydroxy-6-metoxy-1,4-benzoquinol methylase